MLNGEFALTITVEKEGEPTRIFLSTDPLSVRPLFYQECSSHLLISSLLSGLINNSHYENNRLLQGEYREYEQTDDNIKLIRSDIYHTIVSNEVRLVEDMNLYNDIVNTFTRCVEKRLMSERPLCCLLSGGLDSSIVAAIAQRLLRKQGKTLKTYTIGMKGGSDLEYAKQVANFIGSDHTEVNFTMNDGLNQIEDVIKTCESYDITTIRASVGQNLLAKYISENTDYKVILNGDGADEIEMGYLYYHLAPSNEEANDDSLRLIKDISKFDGLRVDRNISHYGLEARVPFLDKEFVNLYYNIDASLKRPKSSLELIYDERHIFNTELRMEKYLFRKAFSEIYKDDIILPYNILWRQKEAFSDGISEKGNSWYIMTQINGKNKISEDEFITLKNKYSHHIEPMTNESCYYRKIFDQNFTNKSEKCIPYYWLPRWTGSKDPSARTLKVY